MRRRRRVLPPHRRRRSCADVLQKPACVSTGRFFYTELKDGRTFTLKPGMSYQVADTAEPHRSYTEVGAMLFIVD